MSQPELERYRASAAARLRDGQAESAARRDRCLAVARAAAAWLRSVHGVGRVVLFGSLARVGPVSWRSDVDLVAWGLASEVYFAAVGELQALDPTVAVDLVRAEDAPAGILEAAVRDGVDL